MSLPPDWPPAPKGCEWDECGNAIRLARPQHRYSLAIVGPDEWVAFGGDEGTEGEIGRANIGGPLGARLALAALREHGVVPDEAPSVTITATVDTLGGDLRPSHCTRAPTTCARWRRFLVGRCGLR